MSSARQRDIRGNTRDRQARRAWLLASYDVDLGPELARCALRLSPDCLGVVGAKTLSVDRIIAGGSYARGNIQPSCQPCQSHQGGVIAIERRKEATA